MIGTVIVHALADFDGEYCDPHCRNIVGYSAGKDGSFNLCGLFRRGKEPERCRRVYGEYLRCQQCIDGEIEERQGGR